MNRKPTLACDADLTKVKFPCYVMPKIDGVRGCNFDGNLTGRSLKPHANEFTTWFYSTPFYLGFDGEFAAASGTHPDLCRLTTSACSTIAGQPYLLWHVFDYITPETENLPFKDRYQRLKWKFEDAAGEWNQYRIRLVPAYLCNSIEELLEWEEDFLDAGYEGIIIRDPNGKAKQGRSTVREGILLRVKRFIEEEAVVVNLVEGQHNGNEATVNELGRTARSSHQDNMVPNGLVGSLTCRVIKDIYDPTGDKKLLLKAGQEITVSPGKMDHSDRKYYWENRGLLIGETIKFKFFPKGHKDKPRFPVFVCVRPESDR